MFIAIRHAIFASLVLSLALIGCEQAPQNDAPAPQTLSSQTQSVPVVDARIETLTIPTYPVGPASDFPELGRVSLQKQHPGLYPYTPQRDLSFTRRDEQYQAYIVENEYLKLTVLPAIGGRLFSMYDKTTKQEVVYHQISIKPALVALRGAWISGGIEWNFPRSHSVTTFSPVSCELVHHDDGSAGIVIGDTERSFHTAWTVEMRLCPGQARLEAHIIWRNPTSDPHDGYWWTNACFPANDQTQLIFPFYKTTGDGGGLQDWPIRDGKDMSWYKEYPNGSSTFRGAGDEDFFAAYDHGKDLALAQYADHRLMPGRKWFTWGNSEAGLTWAKTLSDDNKPYVEVQSGDPLTQGMQFHMQPHEQREYLEYWMPVSRIGPPSRINADAAVSLSIANDVATIGVMPTHKIDGARIALTKGPTATSGWLADISPASVFHQTCKLDGADPATVTLHVWDKNNREVITYQFGHYMKGTSEAEPERGEERRAEATTKPADEVVKFNEGVLDVWQGKFKESREALQPIADANATNIDLDALHYYLGVADANLDQSPDAIKQWESIKTAGKLHDAAAIEEAKQLMCAGKWQKAVDKLAPLAATNQTEAGALTVVALRQMKETSAAITQAQQVLQHDPLNAMAQAELRNLFDAGVSVLFLTQNLQHVLHTQNPAQPFAPDAVPALRDEERRIELATAYMAVKQYAEAEELLRPENDIKPTPIAQYLRAYLLEILGKPDDAKALRALAASAGVRGCLPARLEELAAFQSAIRANDNDASAHYFAGLVLYSRGRKDEAIAELTKAAALNHPDAIVYYCLGGLLREDQPAEAIKQFERAVAIDPKSPEIYLELDSAYTLSNDLPKRIAALERAMAQLPDNDHLAHRLAIAYFDAGRYDDALKSYQTHRFHIAEGQRDVHDYYSMALVGRAMVHLKAGQNQEALSDLAAAEEYPENLGIGKPSTGGSTPITQYWRGVIFSRLGETEAAEKAFQAAIPKENRPMRAQLWSPAAGAGAIHSIWAMRQLGQFHAANEFSDRIDDALDRVARMDPPGAKAYFAIMNGLREADTNPDKAIQQLNAAQSAPGPYGGYILMSQRWCELVPKVSAPTTQPATESK